MSEASIFDIVRYPTAPRPTTLPSALGAVAILRGRGAVPFQRSRVLEIGGNDGTNLLSLAAMAPEAEFVGFDLAAAPIEDGRALAAAAGLTNVTLKQGDILDPQVVDGTFDYIIAHGVYSWIPAEVRAGLMELLGRRLSPDGIAFVDYNALPGANLRRTLKAVMDDAGQGIADPWKRLEASRTALRMFASYWGTTGPEGETLKAEAELLLERDPAALFHDELTPFWEPQLVSEVIAAARVRGLGYLSDTSPVLGRVAIMAYPALAPMRESAKGDWGRFEQLMDFAVHRRFHESLFCRGETGWPDYAVGSIASLHGQANIVASAGEGGRRVYRTERGEDLEIVVDDLALAVLLARMAEAYPRTVSLADVDPAVAVKLLQIHLIGDLKFFTEPFGYTAEPGERPVASPLARAQAKTSAKYLATLSHEPLTMRDPAIRHLISLLDGTRGIPELAAEMTAFAGGTVEDAMQRIPAALKQLAGYALLKA